MIKTPKVLILSNQANGLLQLRAHVQEAFPRRILVIAEDNESFYEKMDWILPELIVIAISEHDLSGLEAFVHVKDNSAFLPVVFVVDKKEYPHRLIESLERKSAGVFTMKELLAKPAALVDILSESNERNKAHFDEYYNSYDRHIKIKKMEQFVYREKGIRHKNAIVELLGKLSADINMHLKNTLKLGMFR